MRTHIEMQSIDMKSGWSAMEGFPGLEVKYLANDLNEELQTGARTRFVRFAPGTKTADALVHTYWEEVYVLSGDLYPLVAGDDQDSDAPLYSLRPPSTPHGPFGSRNGCLIFEVQYFVN